LHEEEGLKTGYDEGPRKCIVFADGEMRFYDVMFIRKSEDSAHILSAVPKIPVSA
jgi:hypothetical protein